MCFFQITFFKSPNLVRFSAGELREVSFDSKFLTDYHTDCNSISSQWYSSRLLVKCECDEVRTNVDIHTLMRKSSITRQDIQDILISFDSGLIYRHVSESFKTRREQVESLEDETNVPFKLLFLSCLVLSQWECKPGIRPVSYLW